ncbi:MAG: hypothetical protein JW981_08150 [Anaerolineae bacterium]|nr:hypothetical protein [Anaerolineae bacterium]
MRRWFLLPLGILIGGVLGILLGWAWPVEYANISHTDLRADYRDEYLLMIAEAYGADGDLSLARERLERLGPETVSELLVELGERRINQGAVPAAIVPLVTLAGDLGVATPTMDAYLRGLDQ